MGDLKLMGSDKEAASKQKNRVCSRYQLPWCLKSGTFARKSLSCNVVSKHRCVKARLSSVKSIMLDSHPVLKTMTASRYPGLFGNTQNSYLLAIPLKCRHPDLSHSILLLLSTIISLVGVERVGGWAQQV